MFINEKKVKRFIAVGAHCDDVELRAGGVFSRLVREGAEGLYIVTVSGGWVRNDVRDKITTSEQARQTRETEARTGAKILGASKTRFLNMYPNNYLSKEIYPGGKLFYPEMTSYEKAVEELKDIYFTGHVPLHYAVYHEDFLQEVEDFFKDWQPDVIFSHSLGDGHPNHNSTGYLTGMVMQRLGIQHEVPFFQWHPGTRDCFTCFQPTHFIELNEADVANWQKAVECFPSQFPAEYIKDFAPDFAHFYGDKCGVKYAQPFTKAFFPSVDIHTTGGLREFLAEEYWNSPEELIKL
jgi:LmbE family N-acetylglucosaminyl deacetylase